MKLLRWLVLLCPMLLPAQTAVTPVVISHVNLVDASGLPCSLCTLATYSAGTTTPLATYTDSSGTSTNTNPIHLDVAGGANIWVGTTNSYKFVLKTALGSTIWTIDNVKSTSGGLPCVTPYTIQFSNSAGTALACDSTITIDPTSHALLIGGAITGNSFTLRNLSSIPASWTFDVTTPQTALASLGDISPSSLAAQAADTALMNATGGSAKPTAVSVPTCVNGLKYTSHTFSCVTAFPLSSLAPQAADTALINATGSSAAPTAVAIPNCATGLTYDTTGHALGCYSPSASTCTDVTGSRAFGTPYSSSDRLMVMVTGSVSGGSGDSRITASWGSGLTVSQTTTTTVAGGTDAVTFLVPSGLTYSVQYVGISGSPSLALSKWVECSF